MGPTGDVPLPMLLTDAEATLGETGGALDTAVEQIALWVGQQLGDTQASLTAVKAKLTKWANAALKTTGATLNDVVAVLQQNAAAYVAPQPSLPPNGVSTGLTSVAPSQQMRSSPVPSLLTDTSPSTLGAVCPPNQYTQIGNVDQPSIPVPVGYHWEYIGVSSNGMNEWACQPNDVYGPAPTPFVQHAPVVSPSGCYLADGTPFVGDCTCLIAYASTDYPDSVPVYNAARAVVGFYSASYVESGACNAISTSPTPVTVTAPTPCELPQDVASWPGQRVVILPFDLNQGGEASAFGQCGELMLKDAMGRYYPTQKYLDALASGDVVFALFPWMRGIVSIGDGPEEERLSGG